MPSLGDIKRRIKSVQNTQQITKAMKMVSASKLKKAQDEIVAARPYAGKMLDMISRLAASMFAESEAKDKEDAANGAWLDDEEVWDSWDVATDASVEDGPGSEDEGASPEGGEAGDVEPLDIATDTPVEDGPEGEEQGAAPEGEEAGGEETAPPVATDASVEDPPEGEDKEAAPEGEETAEEASEPVSEMPVEPWPEDEGQGAAKPGSYMKKALGMIPWRVVRAVEKERTSYVGKALGMIPWRVVKAAGKERGSYVGKALGIILGRGAKASIKQHPLLSGTGGPKKGVVLITSDRGLCGSFNTVMLRTVESFLAENAEAEPALYLLGRRGIEHFKRRDLKTLSSKPIGNKRPDYAMAAGISREFIELYLSGELDEVYVIYSEFKSALTQTPRIRKILPITPEAVAEAEDTGEEGDVEYKAEVKFLYEPSTDEILEDLLPKYVEVQLFRALLESAASEHGARMTAMDGASRSASDMIDSLTLKYNRLRQAAITKELMEIISGAEALKS